MCDDRPDRDRERDDPTAPIPERVGRYEILLPIGTGGMATVYLARNHGIGGFEREVALKLTHAHLRQSADFADDLLEEAKLAARIRHPNVVPVIDVGEDPLGVFLVMEYVEGDTLSSLLPRRPDRPGKIGKDVALRILIDALAGLHAAHELRDAQGRCVGLVHRDFSPQNILVGCDGIARLTDFGIAKAVTRLTHTRSGLVKGKACYMSPEQAKGVALDRRSDVWAGGVMAWEILADRRLYASGGEVQTILELITRPPPRLREVVPDIPPEVDEAVAGALCMEAADRYESAGQFARQLGVAARAHGLLAEVEKVSEAVRSAVEQKLAERRSRAARMFELREQLGRLAARSMQAESASLVRSSLRSEEPAVTIAARPADTDEAPTESEHRWPRRSRRQVVGGAAILVVIAAGSAAAAIASERRSRFAAAESVAPAEPAAAESVRAAARVAESAPDERPPTRRRLRVDGNAPIRNVAAEGHSIGVDPAVPAATLDVPDPLRARPFRIVATSADGRQASAVVTPSASAVRVVFAKPGAARAARSAGTSAVAPLAPNPYAPRR